MAPMVAVRLTVFAAAGAVACWHEAPASLELPLAFSPLTKAPIWTSGWVPCPAALPSLGQQCSAATQTAKLEVQALSCNGTYGPSAEHINPSPCPALVPP
jgi:hypothetical protein